jgi:hypothetical protein
MVSSNIVFIHIGQTLPPYLVYALEQALAVSQGRIYIGAPKATLKNFAVPASQIEKVSLEDLPMTVAHKEFRRHSPLKKTWGNKFWTYTTERFFFLASLVQTAQLPRAFHLENDVLIYQDIDKMGEKLAPLYPNLAGPFSNDRLCIPSIIFINNATALQTLCEFIAHHLIRTQDKTQNDMRLLAAARLEIGNSLFGVLPTLPSWHNEPLINKQGLASEDPHIMDKNFEKLGFVFDAAAFGQFIGGPDPANFDKPLRWYHPLIGRKKKSVPWPGPGYICPFALFDPSHYAIEWAYDDQRQLKPWISKNDQRCKLANLHIHSKHLQLFLSSRPQI